MSQTTKFPVLYKKTKTSAVEYWKLSVDKNVITTEYGHVGTDHPQSTSDVIEQGKNIGKKNATTPEQQAMSEAEKKHVKQLKKGYVISIDLAEDDKVDTTLIKGGISPMLAHKFNEYGHKLVYPAYIQPKLDGHRCVATVSDGTCTLWSRTRKPIISVPHINETFEKLFPSGTYVFDGELYTHEMKNNFEQMTSIINQKTKPIDGYQAIQYHVFDLVVKSLSFHDRWLRLCGLLLDKDPNINVVETLVASTDSDAMIKFKLFMDQGYEGAIMRSKLGAYQFGRSNDLLKMKSFDDGEFLVVGIEEGKGKLKGHVGSFVCVTHDGVKFNAKLEGDVGFLKQCFENYTLWKDKWLTVKYQGLTEKNNVPRFPVGLRFKCE